MLLQGCIFAQSRIFLPQPFFKKNISFPVQWPFSLFPCFFPPLSLYNCILFLVRSSYFFHSKPYLPPGGGGKMKNIHPCMLKSRRPVIDLPQYPEPQEDWVLSQLVEYGARRWPRHCRYRLPRPPRARAPWCRWSGSRLCARAAGRRRGWAQRIYVSERNHRPTDVAY